MMDFDEKSMRALRKDEHVKLFLECWGANGNNGFNDVVLQNNALPELDFDMIDTKCTFLGKQAAFPLMINALTGGTEYTGEINRCLAELAKKYELPIAVGSQTIALEDPDYVDTFKEVRNIHKDGIVVANLSAMSPIDYIRKAVEMIEADGVQLHLNIAQEICMGEGDRCFKGTLKKISEAVRLLDRPVIVKEVGSGISYETAKALTNVGVRYIDTGGKGGTNFIRIESLREKKNAADSMDCSFLEDWGIPTALSLIECRNAGAGLNLISSGGITKAEEIVKSLCIGACIVGIGGVLLHELLTNGSGGAEKLLERLMDETRIIMLLLGAADVGQLHKVPYLLKGEIKELFEYKFA